MVAFLRRVLQIIFFFKYNYGACCFTGGCLRIDSMTNKINLTIFPKIIAQGWLMYICTTTSESVFQNKIWSIFWK